MKTIANAPLTKSFDDVSWKHWFADINEAVKGVYGNETAIMTGDSASRGSYCIVKGGGAYIDVNVVLEGEAIIDQDTSIIIPWKMNSFGYKPMAFDKGSYVDIYVDGEHKLHYNFEGDNLIKGYLSQTFNSVDNISIVAKCVPSQRST